MNDESALRLTACRALQRLSKPWQCCGNEQKKGGITALAAVVCSTKDLQETPQSDTAQDRDSKVIIPAEDVHELASSGD